MEPDPQVVREILQSLYIRLEGEELALWDDLALSPPVIPSRGAFSPEVLDHVDLLIGAGLVFRSVNQIQSNRGPVPTLQPTAAAREWAYLAYDDEGWSRAWERLKVLLEQESTGEPEAS